MPRQFNQPYQPPTTNEWMFQLKPHMWNGDPWEWASGHPQLWDRVPFSERHRLPATSGLYAVFCQYVVHTSEDDWMDEDQLIYVGQSLDIKARHQSHHRDFSFRALDATEVGFLEIPTSQLRNKGQAQGMLQKYERIALDRVGDTALNGNTDFETNMRWLVCDMKIKPKALFPETVPG